MGISGEASPAARLAMQTLGGFALLHDGEAVRLRNRKAQALIAYLGLVPPHAQSRERLCGLLWSERSEAQARASLRQTLHDLRQALGSPAGGVLEMRRSEIALDFSRVAVDIVDLLDRLPDCGTPPDVAIWTSVADSLLAGFEDLDPAFASWLRGFRQSLQERLLTLLERRLDGSRTGQERRQWATILSLVEPSHELACRCLMESDAERGDIASALKRYRALWELLEAELDVEPSPETQELAVRLKSLSVEQPRSPPASGDARLGPRPTIVVGPFEIGEIAERLGYLVRGFRQELIATLLAVREWVVIESSEQLAQPAHGGVYFLSALAYPAGGRARLVPTLKQVTSGRFIWSEPQSLDLLTWFETCRQVVQRIAASLEIHISADRQDRLRSVPDVSLPIYDRWLRAQDLMLDWDPEEDRRAESILRSIVAEAPEFHRAKMGLAQLLNSRHLVFPGLPRIREADREALELARFVADVDPLYPQAKLCLGWSYAMCGRHGEAVEALTEACRLSTTHPHTLASAADALMLCGQGAAALELVETSLELDFGASRLLWAYRVSVYFFNGLPEQALDAVERSRNAISLSGGYGAAALAALGRIDEARESWRRYVDYIAGRWQGPGRADEPMVAAWFLDAPPIGPESMRRRLSELLRSAGASA